MMRSSCAPRVVFMTGGLFDLTIQREFEGLSYPVVEKPFRREQINRVLAE